MKRFRLGLWIAVVVLLASVGSGRLLAQTSQPGDVLFHETFDNAFDDADQRVANGWFTWSHPELCQCEGADCQCFHPEYKQANPLNVYPYRARGSNAQQYFTLWASHYGGIGRQYAVTPGAHVRVGAWAMAWSRNDDEPLGESAETRMRIGVDPTGGQDPLAATVVWGEVANPPNAWSELPSVTVKVTAAGRLTVFIGSHPRWGMKHNDLYIDDVYGVLAALPASSAPALLPAAPAIVPAVAPPDPVLAGLVTGTGTLPATAGGSSPLAIGLLVGVLIVVMLITGMKGQTWKA